MAGNTRGTKVFTTAQPFEINDDFEDFRARFEAVKNDATNRRTVDGMLQDSPITFNVDTIVAFIPLIDVGF